MKSAHVRGPESKDTKLETIIGFGEQQYFAVAVVGKPAKMKNAQEQ